MQLPVGISTDCCFWVERSTAVCITGPVPALHCMIMHCVCCRVAKSRHSYTAFSSGSVLMMCFLSARWHVYGCKALLLLIGIRLSRPLKKIVHCVSANALCHQDTTFVPESEIASLVHCIEFKVLGDPYKSCICQYQQSTT